MSKRRPQAGPPRDFWPTPYEAVEPLLRVLPEKTYFYEPCAGDGTLVRHLESAGHVCRSAFDIEPRGEEVLGADASKVFSPNTLAITNPPYSQAAFEPIMRFWLEKRAEAWLLVPTDWIANLWTQPLMKRVSKILPVGRVSWLGNGVGGYENVMWVYVSDRDQNYLIQRTDRKGKKTNA